MMDPALFAQDIQAVPDGLDTLAAVLRDTDPWGDVATAPLLAGMGSSAYAARTASGWLRASGVGAVAELATADPGWAGGPGESAVLVSASGGSAETLERMSRLSPGTERLALVNTLDSALAQQADRVIDMVAGQEAGGVACRSYRHTLALLLALGLDRKEVAEACHAAAGATRDLLAHTGWLDAVDDILSPAEMTAWIAPESRIGSALQSALMIREVPRRIAVGCETGDWSHVDVYLTLTHEYGCVLFTGSRWDRQALDWIRERSSRLVSVGEPAGLPGEVHVPLGGDALTRMLTEPVVAELLALRWWQRNPVEAG